MRLSLYGMSGSSQETLQWSAENCTVGRALAVLGEKWSFVILREVFLGIRRFDDLRVRTGISRQVLTGRLGTLVEHGILRRVPYREPGARQRHEYRLTDKGFDLYPVLLALREWGDRYLADAEGGPLSVVHKDCGEPVTLVARCDAGHEVDKPRDLVPRPGPGARMLNA
jgi:DNA-binding HxlR family transcriptional regulator